MNRTRLSSLTFLLLALPGCAGAMECHSLSAARWMLGDWIAGDWKSVSHESWIERGPQTFEGRGSERTLADGKIMNSEELRLVEMAGGVYYLAKVKQNELPVAFALTECSADRLVFENPAHDFPRRLEYSHAAAARMAVTISDGTNPGEALSFERDAAAADPGVPVLAAEDERFAAMIRSDAAQLRSGLADDLEYVHSTGQVVNRQQLIDSIATGEFDYLQIAPGERRVVMLADHSALVRGRGQFQLVVKGSRLDLDLRYLAVYGQGADGRWRLRSWQSLRLPLIAG